MVYDGHDTRYATGRGGRPLEVRVVRQQLAAEVLGCLQVLQIAHLGPVPRPRPGRAHPRTALAQFPDHPDPQPRKALGTLPCSDSIGSARSNVLFKRFPAPGPVVR